VFLRLLTTPTEVIAVGRTTRAIDKPLRTAVTLRDLHCVVPGCITPSHQCEIHHVRPWAKGGPTTIENLATLCVRHHRTVENGTWQLRPRTPADGPGRYWIAEARY
jgi:5-methylcytosine-specific restriction protein A